MSEKASRLASVCHQLPEVFAHGLLEQLRFTLDAYTQRVTPTSEEKEAKRALFNAFAEFLRRAMQDRIAIAIAGSTAYEVDAKNSDLDVVLLTSWGAPNYVLQSVVHYLTMTQNVANRNNSWPLKSGLLRNVSLQLVDSARVPVLIVTTPKGLVCDVSVNTVNSVKHTEYFKRILSATPQLRPLMRLLKYWTKVRRLPAMREGGLPGIVWMLLVCTFGSAPDRLLVQNLSVRDASCVTRTMPSMCQVPTFARMFRFFHLCSSRELMARTIINSAHVCIAKNKQQVAQRVASASNFYGVWDEIVSLEDPAFCTESDPQLGPASTSWFETAEDAQVSVAMSTFDPGGSMDLTSKISSATWIVYMFELRRAHNIILKILHFVDESKRRVRKLPSLVNQHHKILNGSTYRQGNENVYKADPDRPSTNNPTVSSVEASPTCVCHPVIQHSMTSEFVEQPLPPREGNKAIRFDGRRSSLQKLVAECSRHRHIANECRDGGGHEFVARTFKHLISALFRKTIPDRYILPGCDEQLRQTVESESKPQPVVPSLDICWGADRVDARGPSQDTIWPFCHCCSKPRTDFALILCHARLHVIKISSICTDWSSWWTRDFLSRRDSRSVIHGVLYTLLSPRDYKAHISSQEKNKFREVFLPASHLPLQSTGNLDNRDHLFEDKRAVYPHMLVPVRKLADLSPVELLFHPCHFVCRLKGWAASGVENVEDSRSVGAIDLIAQEVFYMESDEVAFIRELQKICTEAPWHHLGDYIGKLAPEELTPAAATFQTPALECARCGIDGENLAGLAEIAGYVGADGPQQLTAVKSGICQAAWRRWTKHCDASRSRHDETERLKRKVAAENLEEKPIVVPDLVRATTLLAAAVEGLQLHVRGRAEARRLPGRRTQSSPSVLFDWRAHRKVEDTTAINDVGEDDASVRVDIKTGSTESGSRRLLKNALRHAYSQSRSKATINETRFLA